MSFTGTISAGGGLLKLRRISTESKANVATEVLVPWVKQVAIWRNAAWETMTYQRLDSGSVTFMGTAQWTSVKDQYTRKTDGVAVPAWGGVKRIAAGHKFLGIEKRTGYRLTERMKRVSGVVQGRRRPSGQRVTKGSIMMADTNRMRREFTTRHTLYGSGFSVALTTNVEYARRQNRMRPFNIPSLQDRNHLRERGARFMKVLAR